MTIDPQFDERLRDDLRALGIPRGAASPDCPPPETWIDLYSGRLDGEAAHAADTAREHLVACLDCREVALDARRYLEAMEPGAPAARTVGPRVARRRRFLSLAAAAILAVAGTAYWWTHSRSLAPASTWIAAEYVPATLDPDAPLLRDATALDPVREAAFARAMEPYVAGDLSRAAAALDDYLVAEPEDLRATFYRGVSLALSGEEAASIPLLETVAREASPELADEARWYLALVALRGRDLERARGWLAAVAVTGSPHAAEAARLAEKLAE